MFGFAHAPELIILLILGALVFGPKRIPEIGKSLGKTIRGFKTETEFLRSEATSIKDEFTSVHTVAQDSVRQSVAPSKDPEHKI